MNTYKIIVLATASQAHTLKPTSHFTSQAHPAEYEFLAAIGESYHNAWKRCVNKTTTWLMNDLEVNDLDPSFDNGYYVEYGIKRRVPRTYEIFRELLGEYWPAPTFSGSGNRLSIDHNYSEALAQTVPPSDELADPYLANDAQEWILEQFRPKPREIELFEGVDPRDLKRSSQGYKLLYELFYNIQQTAYYCDFTLESAQFSFEKFDNEKQAELVEAERDTQEDMWKFILKNQVGPVRWSLKMWTRYNIAESSVRKTMEHFDNHWTTVISQLRRLPTRDLARSLGWEGGFSDSHEKYDAVFNTWQSDFEKWIQSCYPMPEDRLINTGDKICQHGITYTQIREGLLASEDMWKNWALALLKEYKKSEGYDEQLYEEVYRATRDAIYTTGEPHSFRCEFKWLMTRVRYFELIPNWEIARVRDDTNRYFEEIEEFRSALIAEHGVKEKGIYSEEKLDEMRVKKEAIVSFLERWEEADNSVYDQDGEKHRRVIRSTTAELSREANKIYNWYFNMAFKQF